MLVKLVESKERYTVYYLSASTVEDYTVNGNHDIIDTWSFDKDEINEYHTLEEHIALYEDGLKAEDIIIVERG